MSPWLRVLAGGWGTIGAEHLTLRAKVGQICKRSGSKPVSPELAKLPSFREQKRCVLSSNEREREGLLPPYFKPKNETLQENQRA